MYDAIKIVHSYWAYLVVLITTLATLNALIGYFGKREYAAKDFRISLFALIVIHLQLLIGIIIFFVSPSVMWFTDGVGVSEIMKDPLLRLYNVEHPTMMILSAFFVTMGYSRHKSKLTSTPKFRVLALFYSIVLMLILSRIPWSTWLG